MLEVLVSGGTMNTARANGGGAGTQTAAIIWWIQSSTVLTLNNIMELLGQKLQI